MSEEHKCLADFDSRIEEVSFVEISQASLDFSHDFSVVPQEVLGDSLFKSGCVVKLELSPVNESLNSNASIIAAIEEGRHFINDPDGSESS